MAPEELAQAIAALGMRPAAAARYLDMSTRQMRRHLRGERHIPAPVVLLLNCMLTYRLKPLVPKPRPGSY
jgi:hypothetical protein